MRIEVNLFLYWILRIKGKASACEASGHWKGFRTYAQSVSLEDDRLLDALPASYFPVRNLIERSLDSASNPAPAIGLRSLSLGLSH
jgi:hypothetical protein